MSVQFGMANFDGKPVDPEDFCQVRALLAPYGPDSEGSVFRDSMGVFFWAHHTTMESRLETQPHVCASGTVITWDGRLDNRLDLARELGDNFSQHSTDLAIVTGCYEKWGTRSFAKLIGDWAVSIWHPFEQLLVLAKDFLGTRHLYYSVDKEEVIWSTTLDPLLAFHKKSFHLCGEYIAGWYASFPAACLTPYQEIHSVPPASYVMLRREERTVRQYWAFDPGHSIRYRSDGEYEEHFRSVLERSVERRLRSDGPVLAELSGGLDSSSIVCVADSILARAAKEEPRLDTLSYYDDSEPNWDERPYFTKVEEMRGRTGCHVDLHPYPSFDFKVTDDCLASSPGSCGHADRVAAEVAAYMTSSGNRTLLSGIGGDEFMGGVPTPMPELQDLLARGHLRSLARQLKSWALSKRKPWFHLLFEASRGFLPLSWVGVPDYKLPAPWLLPRFVERYRAALHGYENRLKLFDARPSFQENTLAIEALRRQIACLVLARNPPFEKRLPWLDRDLLEFIFAIPREQLVRPGQRRSLMRRALVGTVPSEILNRKRKAYVTRAPLAAISQERDVLIDLSKDLVSVSLGIVDAGRFRKALETAHCQSSFPLLPLMRTLGVEVWLRNLRDHGLVEGNMTFSLGSALGPKTAQEAHVGKEFS